MNYPDAHEISEVIRKPAGYVIEVCGLYVSRMTNGGYHVVCDRGQEQWEREFISPFEAASFFISQRKEMKLGFDMEKKVKMELPIVALPPVRPVPGHGEMFIG